jgi:hypothetical protein
VWGIVALVIAFVIGIVGFLMSMGAIAAVLGTLLVGDAEERHEGSELIDLNK